MVITHFVISTLYMRHLSLNTVLYRFKCFGSQPLFNRVNFVRFFGFEFFNNYILLCFLVTRMYKMTASAALVTLSVMLLCPAAQAFFGPQRCNSDRECPAITRLVKVLLHHFHKRVTPQDYSTW